MIRIPEKKRPGQSRKKKNRANVNLNRSGKHELDRKEKGRRRKAEVEKQNPSAFKDSHQRSKKSKKIDRKRFGCGAREERDQERPQLDLIFTQGRVGAYMYGQARMSKQLEIWGEKKRVREEEPYKKETCETT